MLLGLIISSHFTIFCVRSSVSVAQTTEATGATSHSTITTQRDSTSQFGHASAEEFGDISQPTWTRRWSAWIEPRWKQEPPMHMDEEHGDGTMRE